MEKSIKQLRFYNFLLLAFIFITAAAFHFNSYKFSPTEKHTSFYEKTNSFIETTHDIEKLKNVASSLLEADRKNLYFLEEMFINARNLVITFSIIPLLIAYKIYKLKKLVSNKSINSDTKPHA